jgi:cell division protein FtsB
MDLITFFLFLCLVPVIGSLFSFIGRYAAKVDRLEKRLQYLEGRNARMASEINSLKCQADPLHSNIAFTQNYYVDPNVTLLPTFQNYHS